MFDSAKSFCRVYIYLLVPTLSVNCTSVILIGEPGLRRRLWVQSDTADALPAAELSLADRPAVSPLRVDTLPYRGHLRHLAAREGIAD